jgi:hypothetical protein
MSNWTRREALAGGSAVVAALLCGGTAVAAAAKPAMTMYRNPGCGCCLKWAELAKAAGYPVEVKSVSDIMLLKARLGVPEDLAACHTTEVGGYVVEGHVPFEAVAKLLRDKPKGVAGIAVPGMPAGSPGMEMGHSHGHDHGAHSILEVFAFTRTGVKKAFAF